MKPLVLPLLIVFLMAFNFSNGKSALRINKALSKPLKRLRTDSYAISFRDMSNGKLVYQLNADTPLNPASNIKIITGLAALKYLGPEYIFKTEIYIENINEKGEVKGPIYIKGFGDPSLVEEQVFKIAKALKSQGINTIEGPIVIDNSFFDDLVRNPNSGIAYTSDPYFAETSALAVNFNSIKINARANPTKGRPAIVWTDFPFKGIYLKNRTETVKARNKNFGNMEIYRSNPVTNVLSIRGKVAWQSPRVYSAFCNLTQTHLNAGTIFLNMLKLEGVKVLNTKIETGKYSHQAKLVHTHFSKSLDAIIRDMNKYSSNFIADQLTKVLGALAFNSPGSFKNGIKVINGMLKKIGIDSNNYAIYSGSGLNRNNKITTNAMTNILYKSFKDFSINSELISSLSISGIDGTVRKRFRIKKAFRKFRVKTGRLNGIHGLSGFVNSANNKTYAFSIIINRSKLKSWKVKDIIDQLGLVLLGYSGAKKDDS